jgi:hypothetical protein
MSRPEPSAGPGAPPTLPRVTFDPEVDLSPYELFRRLREGRPPELFHLVDGASEPDPAGRPCRTLRGSVPLPRGRLDRGWRPPTGRDCALFDEDGARARAAVLALMARGVTGVRALYGGLRLYDYALDPRVVGSERYLEPPERVGGSADPSAE